jgi:hypothetical protein
MSVALTNQIFKLEKKVSELLTELKSYKKAYSILMEHWEFFPADIKIDIDEQLKKENL